MNLKLILLLLILFSMNVHASENPEITSFKIPELNNYVNLHTGDLNFEIPLVTVPGRGGLDYDIKMIYESGIKLDQQASEVGLGWKLNNPSIMRTPINVPDDYCGGCVNAQANYWFKHPMNHQSPSYINNVLNSINVPGLFMQIITGDVVSLAMSNAIPTILSPTEEQQIRLPCEDGCNLNVNGFRWHTKNDNGLAKYVYDLNTPDLYTLSGDVLSGQIIFSNHDATEVGPRMHLKKLKGHASDELINMNNCPAPGEALENCEDTVRIEFSTDVTDKTFDQFTITDNDGTQYVFEPTKKYTTVFLDDYVKRSRKRLSPGPFCDYYTSPEKWSTVKLLQSFAYEFGITEILGPDYVDDSVPGISSGDSGNWIKFSYRHWNGLYEKGTPHDGGCMEGPDGSQTMTRENNDLNYVDKIETPTHFAKFNYEYDRTDAKNDMIPPPSGTGYVPRLSSIELFSKSQPTVVIQRIVLTQDYTLAEGSPDAEEGKLTLKRIQRFGLNGLESDPYMQFVYSFNDLWEKYDFDRWGYYFREGNQLDHNQEGAENYVWNNAWALTGIRWQNGGVTWIDYETDRYNRVAKSYPDANANIERDDAHFGGGIRVNKIQNCDGLGECSYTKYLYQITDFDGADISEESGVGLPGVPGETSGVAVLEPGNFEEWNDLVYPGYAGNSPYVGYRKVTVIPGYQTSGDPAPYGWTTYEFTSAIDYPNGGKYIPATRKEVSGWKYGFNSEDAGLANCVQMIAGPTNHEMRIYSIPQGNLVKTFTLNKNCNLWDSSLMCNTFQSDFARGNYKIVDATVNVQQAIFSTALVEPAEAHRCLPDKNNNDEWDYLDLPIADRVSGINDNDHYRGLIKKIISYNSLGQLIKQTDNEYSFDEQTNFGGFSKSIWAKLETVTEQLDGVTKVIEYQYDNLNGLPSRVVEYGNYGNKRISTNNYAFRIHSSMLKDEHMWSQLGELRVYDTDDSVPENLVKQERYVYGRGTIDFPGNPDSQWFVKEAYNGVNSEETKVTTFIDYDNYGNILHTTDSLGYDSYFYYGNNNQCGSGSQWANTYLTCKLNEFNQANLMGYDSRGNIIQETKENNVVFNYNFDNLNRLQTESRNGILLKEYDYFVAGSSLSQNNLNYVETKQHLDLNTEKISYEKMDGQGKEVMKIIVSGANQIRQELLYNPDVLKVSEQTEYYETPDTYDVTERHQYKDDPLLRDWKAFPKGASDSVFREFTYGNVDNEFNFINLRDENGRITQYKYDKLGNLVEVIDPYNEHTYYRYDVLGNIERIINSLNEETIMDYDSLGRLITKTNPESGNLVYTYYDSGNVDTITDSLGIVIDYDYDRLNRNTLINYPSSPDVIYVYDEQSHSYPGTTSAIGKLTTINDGTGSMRLYYDSLGRVDYEIKIIDGEDYTIDYAYDQLDNLKTIIDPNGVRTDYYYNNLGEIDYVEVNGEVVNFAFNPSGTVKEIDYPNGVNSKYSYSNRDWVTSINAEKGDNPIFKETYYYDSGNVHTIGNLIQIFEGVNEANPGDWANLNNLMLLTYDRLRRVTNINMDPQGPPGCNMGPNCEDKNFVYDPIGNRLNVNGIIMEYTDPTSRNRISFDGTYDYTYDANGNMITKTHRQLGTVTTFIWDEENRLKQIDFANGNSETYKYDGKGNRVQKIEPWGKTNYIYSYSGQLVYQEFILDE